MASGGHSEPLRMFSEEINSKPASPSKHTHTHNLTLLEAQTRYIFELWINGAHRGGCVLFVPAVLVSAEERFFRRTQNCDLYVWMGRVKRGTLRNTGGKTVLTCLRGGWCGSPEAPCQFILPAGSVRRSIRSSGLWRERGDTKRALTPYSTLSLSLMMQLLSLVQFNNTGHKNFRL